jgi:hypothetical protein
MWNVGLYTEDWYNSKWGWVKVPGMGLLYLAEKWWLVEIPIVGL